MVDAISFIIILIVVCVVVFILLSVKSLFDLPGQLLGGIGSAFGGLGSGIGSAFGGIGGGIGKLFNVKSSPKQDSSNNKKLYGATVPPAISGNIVTTDVDGNLISNPEIGISSAGASVARDLNVAWALRMGCTGTSDCANQPYQKPSGGNNNLAMYSDSGHQLAINFGGSWTGGTRVDGPLFASDNTPLSVGRRLNDLESFNISNRLTALEANTLKKGSPYYMAGYATTSDGNPINNNPWGLMFETSTNYNNGHIALVSKAGVDGVHYPPSDFKWLLTEVPQPGIS